MTNSNYFPPVYDVANRFVISTVYYVIVHVVVVESIFALLDTIEHVEESVMVVGKIMEILTLVVDVSDKSFVGVNLKE